MRRRGSPPSMRSSCRPPATSGSSSSRSSKTNRPRQRTSSSSRSSSAGRATGRRRSRPRTHNHHNGRIDMKMFKGLAGAAVALALTAGAANAQILVWSTQGTPVEEQQKLREGVFANFPGGVDFQPQELGPFVTRIEAERDAGTGTIGVVAALHGDLSTYADNWADLSDIDLSGIAVSPAFLELGKLGTGEQKYLPWMQATYVMAANKQALQYLPEGADINALTYDQVIAWAKAMAEATGSPKFGFPAGPKGLKHRFFQGFLLPAYTGSEVTKFRSPEAEEAWNKFKELWQYTNPASTNYDF